MEHRSAWVVGVAAFAGAWLGTDPVVAIWGAGVAGVGFVAAFRFVRARVFLGTFFAVAGASAVSPAPAPVNPPGEFSGVVAGPTRGRQFSVVVQPSGTVDVVAAAGVALPLPGDSVRVEGRWVGGRIRAARIEVTGHRTGFWRFAARAQRWAIGVIERTGVSNQGVLRALVVGDKSGVPSSLREQFRVLGVAHVLVVSGLHLGVVAVFVFSMSRLVLALLGVGFVRRWAALCSGVGCVGFTIVTGAQVSTIRACVVAVIVLAGVALRRRVRGIDALGLACLLIVLVDPTQARSPGFQLSFAATTALVCIAGGRGKDRGRIAKMVWASGVAALATAPLTAMWFGEVALLAPISNIAITPVMEFIALPCGLAGVALSAASESAGALAIHIADGAVGVCIAVASVLARWAPVWSPGPISILAWLAILAAFIAAILWRREHVSGRAAVMVTTLALIAIAWTPQFSGMTLVFVDVGQGDATLIRFPEGGVWLIDTGPRHRAGALVRLLRRRGITTVDRVVITHPHADHMGGLAELVRHFVVGEVWIATPSGLLAPHPSIARVARQGVIVGPPRLSTYTIQGATVRVLGPRYMSLRAAEDPVWSTNDNSMVLRVGYAGRSVLFAGDVEADGEAIIAAKGQPVDIVKVPHHGSRSSSSQQLIDSAGAHLAVVSCADANRFGFPHSEVVERWRRSGAEVARTDESGSVEVRITPMGVVSWRTLRGN